MYYSQTYKTKWHDTDACGYLRPSALLMYMQETANLQCRDWNCDLNRLFHEEHLGFLLSRIAVRVDAPLHAYEDIEVRTWCGESRGLTFLRAFSVHREGRLVAEAMSHWALVDISTRKLVRARDFDRPFPIGNLPDETRLPPKAHIPAQTPVEAVGKRTIVYSDLDFNRHMNNTKYPDMFCNFLPGMPGRWVRSLSLSYIREATFGDILHVSRTVSEDDPDTYLFRTTRLDGELCTEAMISLGDA